MSIIDWLRPTEILAFVAMLVMCSKVIKAAIPNKSTEGSAPRTLTILLTILVMIIGFILHRAGMTEASQWCLAFGGAFYSVMFVNGPGSPTRTEVFCLVLVLLIPTAFLVSETLKREVNEHLKPTGAKTESATLQTHWSGRYE